jgi:hypothetical protein
MLGIVEYPFATPAEGIGVGITGVDGTPKFVVLTFSYSPFVQ